MAKLGRNAPCRCGGGKKYKHCHLEADQRNDRPQLVVVDVAERKLRTVVGRMGGVALKTFLDDARSLQHLAFEGAAGTLTGNEAESRLISWKESIEEALSQVLVQDSAYFWLFLTERLKLGHLGFDASGVTYLLYRRILKLAVAKYSGPSGTPLTALPDDFDASAWIADQSDTELPIVSPSGPGDSVVPARFSTPRVGDAIRCERLAYDYWWTTALLRRIWKGEGLKVKDGEVIGTEPNGDSSFLIDQYDARLVHARALNSFGAIFDANSIRPTIQTPFVVAAWANPEPPEAATPASAWVRFVPSFIDTAPLIDLIKKHAEPLEHYLGLSPMGLLTALTAMSLNQVHWWAENPKAMFGVASRGYSVAPRHSLLRGLWDWKERAEELLGWGPLEARVFEDCIGRLFGRPDQIDLWDRTGGGVFLAAPGDTVLTDHSATIGFVEELFSKARSLQGEHGAARGTDFESYTEESIYEQELLGELIFRNEVLRKGGNVIGEIDIGWRVGEVLFIIDCKARGMHPDLDRGVGEALTIRQRDLEESLNQVSRTVKALKTDFQGRVPEGISYLVPLVVSPAPEYLPDRSDRWWLPGDVPRVLTPHELANAFCLSPEALSKSPMTINL